MEDKNYGNYSLTLRVASALNIIVAVREKRIEPVDRRICFALAEYFTGQALAKSQASPGTVPICLAIQRLTGIKQVETIERRLRHLRERGILVAAQGGYAFSERLIAGAEETFAGLCPGRQSLERCLPCPRTLLRELAQETSKSRALTLLGLLLRAGKVGVRFCAQQRALTPLLGLSERSVNYAFDWLRRRGLLSTERPLKAWRRQRDGLFCQLHFSEKGQNPPSGARPEPSAGGGESRQEVRELIRASLSRAEKSAGTGASTGEGDPAPSAVELPAGDSHDSPPAGDFAVNLEGQPGVFAGTCIGDKKLPKREFKKSGTPALAEADVFEVKGQHLNDMRYVFALYLSAVRRGLLRACAANLRNVFYAAYRAGTKGRDPARLFSYLLRHQFVGITAADEAAVNPRLQRFREKYCALAPELAII